MSIFMKLRIAGDALELDRLCGAFPGEHVRVCRKGERFERFGRRTVYGEDVFLLDREYPGEGSPEEAVLDFAGRLHGQRALLQELDRRYSVMVWMSLYPDGYHASVELSHRALEALYGLGVAFDVEITCLKEFYEDSGYGTEASC